MSAETMVEIRLHGRGGQGVVTAAELLSVAAFSEGRHAQAIPSFGSERTGAPVVAFCRVDADPIRLREPVLNPHVVVLGDTTLLRHIDVLAGLRPDGYVLVNSRRTWAELGLADLVRSLPAGHAARVAATALALEHIGRPVPNAALLGGVAALTGLMSLPAVEKAVESRFPPPLSEGNIAAARAAYDEVIVGSGAWIGA